MSAVIVRAGLPEGERRHIDLPERRELTRQFRTPLFDHTLAHPDKLP